MKLTLSTLLVVGSAYATSLVHESRNTIPQDFAVHGPAPSDQVLTFRIGLQKSDFAGLESALYSGQRLSTDEVHIVSLVNSLFL
jgi:hypothetical protein